MIDFGIAKAINQQQARQTLFTQHGVLAGTPEYMSPEQANLDARDVDASSDVYSLGVLLYELLVGTLPFDPKELRKKGLAEILRIIREDNPAPLSSRLGTLPTAQEIAQLRDTDPGTLRRQLSGELNWITMRAMEKDRRCRYNSAAEFAGDIGRYLNNETGDRWPAKPVVPHPEVCVEAPLARNRSGRVNCWGPLARHSGQPLRCSEMLAAEVTDLITTHSAAPLWDRPLPPA